MSNKKFTIQLEAKMNIDQVKSTVQTMQNELSKLKLPQNIGNQLQGTFSKLTNEIEKFQTLSANGIGSTKDFNELASSGNKILQFYNQLANQVKNLGGMSDSQIQKLFPPEIQANIEKANKAMAEYGKAAKASEKDIKDLELEISKAQKETEKLIKDKEKLENKKTVSDTLFKQMGKDADEANIKLEKAQQELKELQVRAEGYKTKRKAKGYVDLVDNQIPQKEAEIAKLEQSWNRLKSAKEKALTQTQKDQALEKILQDITAAQGKVTQLQNKLANLKAGDPQSFNQLIAQLNQIKGINLDPTTATMETVSQAVNNLSSNELERLKKAFIQSGQIVDGAKGNIDSFGQTIDETRGKVQQLDERMSQVNMLKSRIQYFFGLTNSIMLFRRAIVSALNTVKELDATMTEAAVVTKFDVNDMWEQLPTYSKHAQDLGISINGMYQATTLYYQQGLKTNEAMQLGVETMKMAKIASMDSTEATKAMTAALRGFNLELNETSAVRVNDVYSQLAAVTAADTNQIATAMEKTASIAASANMEFETTAALLAQIIETTQEAPETAGTAMKTIIARFAEVKSLRDQGLVSGEDEEGEIIDVNKIQTALRSVGISMEGFFSGEEGLDSVLLKLAEKWGTLDFETQRYIATMAAGSRQQSRFIAMMSDYGRTTELVDQAQNSAGASQKQFEKTQESLATSLNRLKNAWDQFQMGLANNEILKAGIDILTKFLEIINKTTDSISGGNGLVKSIISLGVTAAGLKGAGAVLNGIMASMGSMAMGKGPNLGANLKASFGQKFGGKRKQLIKFDAAGAKAYSTSLKSLQVSLNNVTAAEAKLATVSKRKKTAAEAALAEAKANAERDLAVATGQVSLATDLSNEQSREAVLLNSQGLSIDHAVMAAKAGVTAERYKEIIAEEISNGATEEAIFARVRETAAMEGQRITLNKGIVGRIEEITMTKLGIVSTLASTAAHWLEKKGIDAKNASMLVSLGLVGAAVAAVAALVVLGKRLYDAYKASTLEGRMEAAAEATEKAKEAAESASQAYDDLLSAREGYNELQSQLESLTKGTLEWKAALAESNNQVLELLETYPQLSGYLTRGQHGELEISEAGWDYINEYSANAMANSQTALVASQIDETELAREKIKKNFGDAVSAIIAETAAKNEITTEYGYTVASPISGLTNEVVKDLYDEYQKNPMFFQSEDLITKFIDDSDYEEWQKETLKKDIEAIQKLQVSMSELDRSLKENDVILQAQTEALLQSQVSKETYEYGYAKEVVAGIAQGYSKNQIALESDIENDLWYARPGQDVYDQLAQKYKIDPSSIPTGQDAQQYEVLAALYAGMIGKKVEDLDEGLRGSTDRLSKEIAKIVASDNAADIAEKIITNMGDLTKEKQQDYSVLLSGDISNATQGFTGIKSFNSVKIQEELGFKDEAEMLQYLGFDNKEQLETAWLKVVGLAGEAFESIRAQAKRNGIDTREKDYFSNATHDQLKSYVDLMSYSLTTEASKELEESFNSILYQATPDQRNQIVAAMDSFNWTHEGEDEAFVQFLKDIGVELGGTNSALEKFLKQLDMSNAIFRDFDVSDILNSVKEGMEEAEEIGDSERLTHEQYEKYLEEGLLGDASAWTFDGKGWVNIENGMDGLVQALKENTISNYKTTVDEAKAQKKWYEDKLAEFEEYGKNYNTYGGIVTIGGKDVKDFDWAAYLAQEGLAEAVWSVFFASFKEYENWGRLYNGGLADVQNVLQIDESFDPNKAELDHEKETWENSYDKYYNVVKKINAELRSREQIERQYQRLQERGIATEEKAADLRQKQLDSLKEESKLREALLSKRESQMYEIEKEYSDVGQYAGWDNNLRQVQIDWSKINQLDGSTNEELTSRIEEFISKLEEQQELIEEEEDALQEINDVIWEIYQQGKDEYFNLENKIKDAIIDSRQDEIDKLNNINETINTTNEKLISSIQSQLELERQQRENNNTEQEIADKQARLAYLQQDTSGANALEIMKLQEEIDKAQEDYTDTLIDQKISELQQQNEQAAEQRQQQIDILQSQLDYDISNGQIWEEVRELIDSGFNTETGLLRGSALEEILQKADNFKGLSALEQLDWYKDMDTNMALALSWLKTGATQSLYGEGKQVSFTTADGKVKVGTMDKEGNIITEDGFYAAGTFDMDSTGAVSSSITEQQARKAKAKRNEDDSSYSDEPEKPKQPQQPQSPKYWTIEDFEFYDKGTKYSSKQNAEKAINDWYKSEKNNILKDKNSTRQMVRMEELDEEYEYFANKIIPHYKTGGLADFTGPAWLDGTKSRPEYILNANQTKAFFSLVDVLSSLKAGTSKTPEKSGDNTYDIDINVESIGSDYDVEQLANTIKRLINDDARYRNNNTINLMR